MVVQVFQKMAFSIIVFFSKSIVFYHDQVENAVQIISDVLPYDGNEAPKLLEQEVSEGVLRRPEIEKFIINCAQLVQTKIARDAGTESAPNFWQICLSTKKGQIMPTNNYWHLQIFSPVSGQQTSQYPLQIHKPFSNWQCSRLNKNLNNN